jgi:hypothetical protein
MAGAQNHPTARPTDAWADRRIAAAGFRGADTHADTYYTASSHMGGLTPTRDALLPDGDCVAQKPGKPIPVEVLW